MSNNNEKLALVKKIDEFFCKPEGKYFLSILTERKLDLIEELCEANTDNLYKIQGQLKGLQDLINFVDEIDVVMNNVVENDIDNY